MGAAPSTKPNNSNSNIIPSTNSNSNFSKNSIPPSRMQKKHVTEQKPKARNNNNMYAKNNMKNSFECEDNDDKIETDILVSSEDKNREYIDKGVGTTDQEIRLTSKNEFEIISTDKANLYVMASLKAPSKTEGRLPLDLVVVVDVSGSMSGERIQLTQITARWIVENLKEEDRLSLVTFSSGVTVHQALTKVDKASRKQFIDIIDQWKAGGGTQLDSGLVAGIKEAVTNASTKRVSAVMLLTDGHANGGSSGAYYQIVSKGRNLLKNSSTSVYCFGYGVDHDANFLQKVAQFGRGLYYFIEDGDEVGSTFGDCLGGLMSVTCQKMKMIIEPAEGVTIKKVLGSKPPKPSGSAKLNITPQKKSKLPSSTPSGSGSESESESEEKKKVQEKKEEPKEIKKEVLENPDEDLTPGKSEPETIKLGDFYSEESRDIVFHLNLPSCEDSKSFPLSSIKLKYFNVLTNQYEMVSVTATVTRSVEAKKKQVRDLELDKQINRLIAASAMEQAQSQAFDVAKKIITDSIAILSNSVSSNDPFTMELIKDLEDIKNDMKDAGTYERVAKKKMVWKGEAHKKQRAIGNAGNAYSNSIQTSMKTKASAYQKSNYGEKEVSRKYK